MVETPDKPQLTCFVKAITVFTWKKHFCVFFVNFFVNTPLKDNSGPVRPGVNI
jgi:hypothetical protein